MDEKPREAAESKLDPTDLSFPPAVADWWQRAVFYEIYVRSFKDTNDDGIGDLNGITSKLEYLADLGIDAIWITPFYPSPQVDFGYDIRDYQNVDPQYGTLADFDRLVKEAHQRGIRVICDMVLNHTSDQHPWFLESRPSRRSPRRDWYIWHDPRGDGPPNNWYSAFGPSAWTLDRKTGQYYYHFFHEAQPDLNWRNPAVERAMFDAVRFWLKRGVDGFRLDTVNCLFEDPQLRDNPVLPSFRPGSKTEHAQELKYNGDLPEIHDVLQRLRATTDEFGKDRILIGEIWVKTVEDLMRYYGLNHDEVHLAFDFFLSSVPSLDAAAFRANVESAERALKGRLIAYMLNSHDMPRSYDRYGNGPHNDRIAKLLATMLLSLSGAPFIYYGEEIGMVTTEPATPEEVLDPLGKCYWPAIKGRDGERTPMQWDSSPNAGFTRGRPWLGIPPSAAARNVATESADPLSLLNFYRRAIRLRRSSPALHSGKYLSLENDPHIVAYRREAAGQTVLVALNMSAKKQSLQLDSTDTCGARQLRRILDNVSTDEQAMVGSTLDLIPYQAVVLEVVEG
jgi:alpha-glucosidase